MNWKNLRSVGLAACAAAVVLGGSALAAPVPVGEEANIPQARARITNWVLDDSRGIWVESMGHQWYYGQFLGPCYGLGARDTVAFKFSPDGSLNRFSQVIAPRPHHQSCAFTSFVTSAGPSADKVSVPRPFVSR